MDKICTCAGYVNHVHMLDFIRLIPIDVFKYEYEGQNVKYITRKSYKDGYSDNVAELEPLSMPFFVKELHKLLITNKLYYYESFEEAVNELACEYMQTRGSSDDLYIFEAVHNGYTFASPNDFQIFQGMDQANFTLRGAIVKLRDDLAYNFVVR